MRTAPQHRRLGRSDWVAAALDALIESGPAAVAIEPLAAAMGTTKGSGYHHFRSRDELLRAALDAYRAAHTRSVIDQVDRAGGSPQDRLVRLFERVKARAGRPTEFRMLASVDPIVREAIERVTAERIGYLDRLMRDAGFSRAEAHRRSLLAYFTYLGQSALAESVPSALPGTRHGDGALQNTIIQALLSSPG
jgi:AcrR family transcriptional regulator